MLDLDGNDSSGRIGSGYVTTFTEGGGAVAIGDVDVRITDIDSSAVAGATVNATVVSHGRGEKVGIFKMRRRKHYQKHQGHRQNFTEIEISGIAA